MFFDENKIRNLNLEPWMEIALLFLNKVLTYIPILLFFFIIYTFVFPKDYDKMNRDNFAKRKFSGKVIKCFIDYQNHAAPTIVFSNNSKEGIISKLFSEININDSVVKKEGQLVVSIYKVNGQLVVFDYRK